MVCDAMSVMLQVVRIKAEAYVALDLEMLGTLVPTTSQAVLEAIVSVVAQLLDHSGCLRNDDSLGSSAVSTLISAVRQISHLALDSASRLAGQTHNSLMLLLSGGPAAGTVQAASSSTGTGSGTVTGKNTGTGSGMGSGSCTGTMAAAASQAALLLLLPRQPPRLSDSRQLASDNRQTAIDVHVPNDAADIVVANLLDAGMRSECVAALTKTLSRSGDAKVRLNAAQALQTLMNHALRPPPYLSEHASRYEMRKAASSEAESNKLPARGEDRSVETPGDLEQPAIVLEVSESSERPISLSVSASVPIAQPPCGVSRTMNHAASEALITSASVQTAVQQDSQIGDDVFISKQLIAAVAAAAADAVSDESAAVGAASLQLLQQVAAPAAVLASDPDAEVALEQPKWLIRVRFCVYRRH